MPLGFDPQGFPVVNAILAGVAPAGGALSGVATADAGNSVAAADVAELGGTWIGTTLDMATVPALQIDAFFTSVGGASTAPQAVYVIWSDITPWTLADALTGFDSFGVGVGQPSAAGGLQGGMTALVNRKGKYATVLFVNGAATHATLTINTRKLGAPVEEYDSTKTGCLGAMRQTLVVNSDAVQKTNLKVGGRHLARVVGGDGICLKANCPPDVTTAEMPFYDGDVYGPFRANSQLNAFQAIKRTAGTSNATVIIVTLDNNENM